MLILLAILSSLRLRPVFAVRGGPKPVPLWSSIRFPLHPRNGHLQSKNTRPHGLVWPDCSGHPCLQQGTTRRGGLAAQTSLRSPSKLERASLVGTAVTPTRCGWYFHCK